MDFNKVVADMVGAVPGSLAAVIMASDGIAIAEHVDPSSTLDIQTLGVEYTSVLSEIKKATEVLEAGRLEELTVCSDTLTLIVRLITDEYFLAMALSPEGNYGKGRYMVRITAPRLVEEF